MEEVHPNLFPIKVILPLIFAINVNIEFENIKFTQPQL